MGLSLVGGGFGAVWFLLTSPQQILTVFIKNYLGASASQLGFFIAAFNIVSLAHLGSIICYSRLGSIKRFWLSVGLVHRSLAFVVSAAAFLVAFGGSRTVALYTVMGATLLTFFIGSTASSGWWAWIHELVPPQAMGRYFGRRSAVAQGMNICFFFVATLSLDLFMRQAFMVYGFIYLCAGLIGLTEHALHIPIPEPETALKHSERNPLKLSTFFAPLRSAPYRNFCLIAGCAILSINVAAPFFAPYITDPERIGAPNIWLGIMYAISQLIWVLLVPFWGTIMDRFGRKAVSQIGMLSAVSFLGYLLVSPGRYSLMLILIAVVWGFFAPALYEGLNQVMFSLLPRKDRNIYIAWYWAILGTVSSLGPIIGGALLDSTGDIRLLVLTSLVLLACAFLLMDKLNLKKEKRLVRVVPSITTPTIVKAYYNMPVIASSAPPRKVERALKRMSGSSGNIALEEILIRLEDPDQEIREEAVKALGRIGGDQAVDALIKELADPSSLVRPESARALGRIGSAKALPHLIDGLASSEEELCEACARALGSIDDMRGSDELIKLIRGETTLRIKVSSAEALSRKGYLDALRDILKIRDHTYNPVMRKQLAISIANLLGRPGEFYSCLTGTEESRDQETAKLFRSVYRNMRTLERTDKGYVQHIIKNTLPKAIDLYDQGDFPGCFTLLYAAVSNLLYRFAELQGADSKTLSPVQLGNILVKQEPLLYAGFTLFRWLGDRMEQEDGVIEETDVLLCFYFLKYYGKKWRTQKTMSPAVLTESAVSQTETGA